MPSLFSRPTFKAATSSDDEASDSEPKDIFNHSERSYDNLIAEEERKRKERVERQKVKAERRDSSKVKKRDSDEVKREDSTGSPKRRRINGEETAELLNSVGLGDSKKGRSPSPAQDKDVPESSPLRRSPRKPQASNGKRSVSESKEAAVVELGDSSDVGEATPSRQATPQPAEEELDDESDEELAALARQARARRIQQRQQDKTSSTPGPGIKSPTPQSGGVVTGYRSSAPSHDPDPAIKLFISSPIPDTRPIVIVRRMSQRLQEVRTGWCKKMEFKEDFINKVFLIHRMRRYYDMTTVRSLGLNVEADGQVTLKGAEGKEGVDQLHLEAVTQELFDEMKAEQEKEALKRSGQWDPSAEAGAEEEATAATKKQGDDTLIKVVLRARNKADFKLKVKPVSSTSQLFPQTVY